MKRFLFYLTIGLSAILYGCTSDEGKPLSDYNHATPADSMYYYLIQLRAHEYWQEAENDTSLRSIESRKRFLSGLRDGLAAITDDDPLYNRGVEAGVRMAINLIYFEKTYGVDIDKSIAAQSYAYALFDGKNIPEHQYADEFYRILNNLKAAQRVKDHEKGRQSLIEYAREHNFMKLDDDLYYKSIKTGSGPYPTVGNQIYVVVNYDRADGGDIAVPSPGLVTIGGLGVPDVLNRAYSRLNRGAVAEFAIPAESIFKSRTYMMGMKPEDVIRVTVTLNEITTPNNNDAEDPRIPDAEIQ